MITLAIENWPMICALLVGGILIGVFFKFIGNTLAALLSFKEISDRAKRDAEIIRRESESVMPLARKMTEMCESLGQDMWKMQTYHKMRGEVNELEREVKRLSRELADR